MTTSAAIDHHDVPAGDGTLHVAAAGDPSGEPIVFLHGWPESWRAWEQVLHLAAADGYHAIAVDLPGIGRSASSATSGRKTEAAAVIAEALAELGVQQPVIVGHDAGGMVAYAYLRQHHDALRAAVITSVVVPGLDPWDQVLAIPQLWHFGLHAVPDLPELLVQGKEHEYFDWFYGAVAHHPEAITPELRAAHALAYRYDDALTAGFNWYRAFDQDVTDNRTPDATARLGTPLLYLRGAAEFGDLATYERGFRDAGLTNVQTGLVDDAGHFVPTEAPAAAWAAIRDFTASLAPTAAR